MNRKQFNAAQAETVSTQTMNEILLELRATIGHAADALALLATGELTNQAQALTILDMTRRDREFASGTAGWISTLTGQAPEDEDEN